MGPYLSARLWARQATPAKRSVAVACAAAAAVLAGLLVVPAASNPDEQIDSGGLPAAGPRAFDETSRVDGPTTDSTATSSPEAGGTTAGGSRGGATNTTGGAGGPGGGGTVGGRSAPNCVSLKANDAGVTSRTITVGFGLVDFSGAGATNETVTDARPDTDKVVQSFVDYANAQGGVACRTLVAKSYNVSPLDSNDQAVKCRRAVDDDKVFLFVDSYTMSTPAAQGCLTERKTPLLTTTSLGEANLRAQYPYAVSSYPSYDRSAFNWIHAAKDNGFFDPAKGFRKLGLLDDDCLPDLNANIKRELARVGVTDVAEFTFRCSAIATPAEAQQAVLAFEGADVTHVFGVTFAINVGAFSTVAGQQEAHYRYGLSDAWSAAETDVIEFGDPEELHDTFAITSTTLGRPWETFYQPPTADWCSEAMRRKGLRPLETGKDEEAALLCGNFLLFLRMAELAGPMLTRRSFALSLPGVGRMSFPVISDGDYSGKLSGGDEIALLRIDKGCACFQRTREFAPGYL